jgi:hypothetical protein
MERSLVEAKHGDCGPSVRGWHVVLGRKAFITCFGSAAERSERLYAFILNSFSDGRLSGKLIDI